MRDGHDDWDEAVTNVIGTPVTRKLMNMKAYRPLSSFDEHAEMLRILDEDVLCRRGAYSYRDADIERVAQTRRQAAAAEAERVRKMQASLAEGRLSTYVADLWQVEQLESADKHRQAFGADRAKFEAHHRAALTAKFGADLRQSSDGKTFGRWIDDELIAVRDRKKLIESALSNAVLSVKAVTTELERVTGVTYATPPLKDLDSAQRHIASTRQQLELANALALQLQEQLEVKLRRRYWASLSPAVQRELAPSTLGCVAAKALYAEHETAARASTLARLSGVQRTVPAMEAALAGLRDVEVKKAGDECPQCGKRLALRKRGYDGATFIGCTGYPTCVYAWSVELGDRTEMRALAKVLAEVLINVDVRAAWLDAGLPSHEWLEARAFSDPYGNDVAAWLWVLGHAQELGALEKLRAVTLTLGISNEWRDRARQAWSTWLGGDVAHVANEKEEALSQLVQCLSRRVELGRLADACRQVELSWSPADEAMGDPAQATWRHHIEAAHVRGPLKLEQLRDELKRQLRFVDSSRSLVDSGWFDMLWSEWTGEHLQKCECGWRMFKDQRTGELRCGAPRNGSLKCTRVKAGDKIAVRKDSGDDMVEINKAASTSTISGLMAAGVEMAKDDLGDATWRTAAGEAIELAKVPVKAGLKRVTGFGRPFAKFMHDAVDTPLGEGALAVTLGFGIAAYAPLRGKTLGPKTVRLSKELRVWGFEKYTSKVARFIIAPIRNELTALVESLPGLASLES